MTTAGAAAGAVGDTAAEDRFSAPAGRLSDVGRRAALAAALPLLGTYFEAGSRDLRIDRGPARGSDAETDSLLAALRLRVALAATGTLTRLAEEIGRRPNFRYEQVRKETVGEVRGRLDVARYATGVGRLQSPPRYPVTEVVRTQATPENTLLVCAAHWLLTELAQPAIMTVLPDGPERNSAHTATETIRRLLSDPLFAVCRPSAREVMRLRQLPRLVGRVRQRLESGQVGSPRPYRELVRWMSTTLSGQPAARAGDLDWSFYGDSFDPKLFELWCLSRLASHIGDALGQTPPVPDLTRRSRDPMYRWETPLGDLEIHFQRSPSTADWPQVWNRSDGRRGLGGIPDIMVIGRPHDGDSRLVLLDPKLRQRDAVASDELFKMLGYFEQFRQRADGRGAIVLYGREDRAVRYSSDGAGQLHEVTVDPARSDEEASAGWTALCGLALGAVSLADLAPQREQTRPYHPEGSEEATAQAQQRAVHLLGALATQLGDAALRPWRSQLEAAFGLVWPQLGPDVQEMCTTAVYLGNFLTEGRDFSGPVLGLAAAAEKLLWDSVLAPAAATEPTVERQHMLGQMLELLRLALAGNSSKAALATRAILDSRGVDSAAMSHIVQALITVNRVYRRPAAHRDLLPRADWLACHRVMMLQAEPILPRLASLLLLP